MKLELKHLAPYLPYGLIIKVGNISVAELTTDFTDHDHIKVSPVLSVEAYQPILRPLSDLTKEITHKGEVFVPMQKLLDIINGPDADTFSQEGRYHILTANYEKWAFGYKNGFGFYFNSNGSGWDLDYVIPQLEFFNKLHEWMFDTNGLIESELAISVHDLTENPYEI